MARLSAKERAALPDRAFAYIDSAGRRRLPISDASHVRNALARFGQVDFESEAARERARRRLLGAARRFRIVPVGFIDREIRTARALHRDELPTGFVTLMMTDIEGSTPLVARLADRYADALEQMERIQRSTVEAADGIVVEVRADELFAVFVSPTAAIAAAIELQRALAARSWHDLDPSIDVGGVRVRIGLHAGYPTRRGHDYVGMAVNITARVCDAAHGGQIVVSDDTAVALTGLEMDAVTLSGLGRHGLRGVPGGPIRLHQVVAPGLATDFPALRLRPT